MTTHKQALAAAALLAGLSGAAQAALIDRGGGLIYDTTLNVTWLQDANYAQTSGYDADGKMNFFDAKTWVADLSYYDSVRDVTYTDWRLPGWTGTGASGCQTSNNGTDCGFNVDPASSEMAHLFFVDLGNTSSVTTTGVTKAGTKGVDWGLVNTGSFTNLQSDAAYWTGTQFGYNIAFQFDFGYGAQTFWYTTSNYYALAVRAGDVAAVPEADTWAMLLAGLGLVGVATRRKRRSR
jgi:hypothetical protein